MTADDINKFRLVLQRVGWSIEDLLGAQSPEILLKNEAIPTPVPRFGAGKTSGVLYSFSNPILPTNAQI